MLKRAGSNGDEPSQKRLRTDQGNSTAPSALTDNRAWAFMEQFLMTTMTYSEMEDAFYMYLGDRYSPDDWAEARDALWSDLHRGRSVACQSHAFDDHKNNAKKFLLLEASEDDDEDEEREEDEAEDVDHRGGTSARSPPTMRLPGTSAKERLAATIADMVIRFEENPSHSSQGRQGVTHRDTSFSDAIVSASGQMQPADKRMYLLHVQRASTEYIAEHLRRQQLPVTVSPWVAGQLYVVTDSFKSIVNSIPASHTLALKECLRITEAEREAVERSRSELPNQAWVRIRDGKYKGDIAQVFNPSLPNGLVAVLIASRNLPYPVPRRSQALLERSRLPNSKAVSDILRDGAVVGLMYKGETRFLRVGDYARVIQGSLRGELGKIVSIDHTCDSVGLELTFHGGLEDIELPLQDLERVFRVGDSVRVVAGSFLGLEGYIIQMDEDIFRICQAVSKEELPTQQYFEPSPDSESIEIGDNIRVGDGPHAGKFGIVTWITSGSTYLWFRDVCTQDDTESSGELSSISVPTAFVQRTNLTHTLQYTKERGYDVRPGDVVSVVRGPEYEAKGFVHSVDFPNARLTLVSDGDRSLVDVPMRFVAKIRNASLDAFRNDIGQEVFIIGGYQKGYRATLCDLTSENCTVTVHGQRRTTVKLPDVVTKYGMRLNGAMLEGAEFISFCDMRKRSFQALPPRSITPPVEDVPASTINPTPLIEDVPASTVNHTPPVEDVPASTIHPTPPVEDVPASTINPTPPVEDVPASTIDPTPSLSSAWSTWSARPENTDMTHNPTSSVNPSPSTNDPWTVDKQDIQQSNDARVCKPRDSTPIPWLMSKEFASKLFTYHVVLKVSPKFEGGWLAKRFVSTACPDPFCGENGPAPEDCVAVFCTSNHTGAKLQHRHIPAQDLSPAPPRKKHQQCLVLDGTHRGLIVTISKCSSANRTIEFIIAGTVTSTLRFDQICLVEPSKHGI
ncbi:hypothetical protein DEU56DRAFT_756723 [Suillus clintonianus]|uniref:uncharacterized protein n=1 Tax=Suillus clintonianus TaxID=1904413 RepID=UPI001B87DD1A|nr:uncharacterized protein DEU56DRAFT_756723 [Suillus clintonianus]KAG2135082.1 hypothetical protein DEU56DRAFT_756723 [Suillus clintonianus]